MEMRLAYKFFPGILVASGLVAFSGAAWGQVGIEVPTRDTEIRRGETVLDRDRPEYDPLGTRIGSFVLLPRLRVSPQYNDNIFSDETDEKGDLITVLSPNVSLLSDWGTHSLRLDGGANIGRYYHNGAEDYEDFRFGASGRIDVMRRTNIRPRLSYRQSHEDRSSPDDVSGVEPTIYDVLSAGLEASHTFNRLTLTLGGTLDQYDFDDVGTSLGGTINNDDRDRDEVEGSVRVGYEIVPQYEAFVRGAYNVRDYDSAVDDNGLNRDSDGYEFVAGVAIDFGGITYGDFFVGYTSQDYEDPLLNTASGPVVGADIVWNVTELTTIVGSVSRVVRESTTMDPVTGAFASGRFFTTVGVTVDHELRRNVLLGANVSASQDDFEGISRTDDIFRAGVNAKYLVNRYANVGAEYKFRMRESDVAGGDFTENVFLLRAQVQY